MDHHHRHRFGRKAIFKEEGIAISPAGGDAMALAARHSESRRCSSRKISRKRKSKPISGKADIENVASISANNDREIGKIMADAMEKVGKDGVITVEEEQIHWRHMLMWALEGMQFDRGFLSPNFITDPDEMVVELEKPLILIFEDKISNASKLIPLLEKIQKAKKPLLIIAEDVESEAACDIGRQQRCSGCMIASVMLETSGHPDGGRS